MKIERQVRDLTIVVEWPHPRRFRSREQEAVDPQLPFEVSLSYLHPHGGNMQHMQYLTQRALDTLFEAPHVHCCDVHNRSIGKFWGNQSPEQQRRSAMGAFLYLYFLPDGEGRPFIAAGWEQMQTYIPNDLFADICDAFDISHHERMSWGKP